MASVKCKHCILGCVRISFLDLCIISGFLDINTQSPTRIGIASGSGEIMYKVMSEGTTEQKQPRESKQKGRDKDYFMPGLYH